MIRYVRNRPFTFETQGLLIQHEGLCYFPLIQHTAVEQNRPIGQVETFREHQHNLYHVVVFMKTQGGFSFEGEVIEALPDTVVCISPGQKHDFVTYRQQAVYSEVTFSLETQDGQVLTIPFGDLLQTWVGTSLNLPVWQTVATDTARQFESTIREITDHARGDAAMAPYCCQRSLARLLEGLAWTCDQGTQPHPTIDEKLVKAKRFIDHHYLDPIALDQLATLATLSRGYFFRAFKQAYGHSPLEYQQQLRLESAKTLLRATALRCHEVARRCGYENVQFFHRLFKRTTGQTPRQFRQQNTLS